MYCTEMDSILMIETILFHNWYRNLVQPHFRPYFKRLKWMEKGMSYIAMGTKKKKNKIPEIDDWNVCWHPSVHIGIFFVCVRGGGGRNKGASRGLKLL